MTRPLQNGRPFSSTYIIYHFAGAGKVECYDYYHLSIFDLRDS